MSKFLDFFLDNYTLDQIQFNELEQYFENPYEQSDLLDQAPVVDIHKIRIIDQLFDASKFEIDFFKQNLVIFKKIVFLLHVNLMKQSNINGCLAFVSILLKIVSMPFSVAFNLVNSSLYSSILARSLKFVTMELKSSDSGGKTFPNNENEADISIEMDLDEGSSDDEIVGRNKNRKNLRSSQNNTQIFSPSILTSLVQSLQRSSQILLVFKDEHILFQEAELLVVLYFLAKLISPKKLELSETLTQIIVACCAQSDSLIKGLYRALMPTLTLTARNPLLTNGFKLRKQCHREAVQLIKAVFFASLDQSLPVLTGLAKEQSIEFLENSSGSIEEELKEEEEVQQQAEMPVRNLTSERPLPHIYFLGMLQRMVLISQDSAAVRGVIEASVMDLLSYLIELVPSGQSQEAMDKATHERGQEVLSSIHHFVHFITQLSVSKKIPNRAFSLDIGTSILFCPWAWDLQTPSSTGAYEPSSSLSSSHKLLQMIVERCQDQSPTVRLRALNSLYDILATLNDNENKELTQIIYDLSLGVQSEVTEGITRQSLFDILRDRIHDDKSLVRSKAMQTYVSLFLIDMPSPSHVSSDHPRSFKIAMSEDDLSLIGSLCHDTSLSCRKQCLLSMTELLRSRPYDKVLMEHWIHHVLPLIYDPEASVSNKLSAIMHDMLFEGLIQWHYNETHKASSEFTFQPDMKFPSLWQLINLISAMGLSKLLKSLVSQIVKQGLIKGHIERNEPKHASLKHILDALKYACMIQDSLGSIKTISSSSFGNIEVSSISGLQQQQNDPERVSQASWVLLESIVSIQNINILGKNGSSIPFNEFIRSTGPSDFVIQYFKSKHDGSTHEYSETVQWDSNDICTLQVLEKLASNLPKEDILYMDQQLKKLLHDFNNYNPPLISSAIRAKQELTHALHLKASQPPQSLYKNLLQWAVPLLNKIDKILNQFILSSPFLTSTSARESVEDSVFTALFMLGEICMMGFSVEEEDNLTKKKLKVSLSDYVQDGYLESDLCYFISVAEGQCRYRLVIKPSLIDAVKMLMGHFLPIKQDAQSQPTSGVSNRTFDSFLPSDRECPERVRANAFITMGKLCMRDKKLARDNINVYLREISPSFNSFLLGKEDQSMTTSAFQDSHSAIQGGLEGSLLSHLSSGQISSGVMPSAAVRSNSLLVLGDMCLRYTDLIDHHIDVISQALQDKHPMVRKNAMILLSQLVLQDYLKWKGFLLYRFLLLLIDPEADIAEFSRNLLQTTFSHKFPALLTSHFVEAIIVLNNCQNHPNYSAVACSGIFSAAQPDSSDSSATSNPSGSSQDGLYGHQDLQLNQSQRFRIYSIMLENATNEERIQITAKLSQEVLSVPVDTPHLLPRTTTSFNGSLSPMEHVLEDSFLLLKSSMLKLVTKKDSSGELEEGLEEPNPHSIEPSATSVANAKNKVLKKLSTQHLLSHLLPVVLSLKNVLESLKSPLQGLLMDYLIHVMKANKSEVEQALSYDPTLKAEIEFDIRKFERENKQRQERMSNDSITHSHSKTACKASASKKPAITSPYLNERDIRLSTIKKASLKKNHLEQQKLLLSASHHRLSSDENTGPISSLVALKSASSDKSVIRSECSHLKASPNPSKLMNDEPGVSAEVGADIEDYFDRLTSSQTIEEEYLPISEVTRKSAKSEPQLSVSNNRKRKNEPSINNKSRRKSWGIVVNSLCEEDSAPGTDPNTTKPNKENVKLDLNHKNDLSSSLNEFEDLDGLPTEQELGHQPMAKRHRSSTKQASTIKVAVDSLLQTDTPSDHKELDTLPQLNPRKVVARQKRGSGSGSNANPSQSKNDSLLAML